MKGVGEVPHLGDRALQLAGDHVEVGAGIRRGRGLPERRDGRAEVTATLRVEEVERLVEIDAVERLDDGAGLQRRGAIGSGIEVEVRIAEEGPFADRDGCVVVDCIELVADREGDDGLRAGVVEVDRGDLADLDAMHQDRLLGGQPLAVAKLGLELIRLGLDRVQQARGLERLVQRGKADQRERRADEREDQADLGDSMVQLSPLPRR